MSHGLFEFGFSGFDRVGPPCSAIDGDEIKIGAVPESWPLWLVDEIPGLGIWVVELAAIAQASVIERAMIAAGVPPSFIQKWAFPARGALYYLRAFIDLRREPRWLPDFVLQSQLKAELIGRVFTAGFNNAAKLGSDRARELFAPDDEAPIKPQLKFPFAYLPGPLEGGVESVMEMPSDIEANLKQALESQEPTGDDFISLVNSPLIFKVGPQLAQLAAQALRRAKYQLRKKYEKPERFVFALEWFSHDGRSYQERRAS